MINTVIRNLVFNAIKFCNSGDTIIVSSKNNKDNVSISVKDSGIGISEDVLPNLFKIEHSTSTEGTNKEQGRYFR